MRNTDNVVSRAYDMASVKNSSSVSDALLLMTLYAIADEWPAKDDESTLGLYLVHDLRRLADELLHIAGRYEAWDAEQESGE